VFFPIYSNILNSSKFLLFFLFFYLKHEKASNRFPSISVANNVKSPDQLFKRFSNEYLHESTISFIIFLNKYLFKLKLIKNKIYNSFFDLWKTSISEIGANNCYNIYLIGN
jgi:hypothetical protein